ncbi:unnamed protein product [Spirodela intermedia]|nr:unnamed protein product [Spirodela intermedia]CAA6665969.1 unnamed protein product [Spirodela intermedia]
MHIDFDDGFRPLVSISSSLSSSLSANLRKEGFAVEKRSSDPYKDFRGSMVEMIVEKQIFGATELEHLLRSYLALNDLRHHPIIVQVFSEIWEALFGN